MRRRISSLLLAITLLLSGCIVDEDGEDSQPFNGRDYNPPIEAPAFNLSNQFNTSTSLSDYTGKVVVVAFTYTACPDVCLVLEANLNSLMAELGDDYGTEAAIISITIDPERDTVEHLANWTGVRNYSWPHLTSTDYETLAQLWNDWGVAVSSEPFYTNHTEGDEHEGHEHGDEYEVGHSVTITFLVDRDGMKRVYWSGSDWSVDGLLEDVQTLIAE